MIRVVPLALASLIAFTASSRGDLIITLSQNGSNVEASGSGTLDLTGLTLSDSGHGSPLIDPSFPLQITIGGAASPGNDWGFYTGPSFSGPSSFGSGGGALADTASGQFFGVGFVPNLGLGIFVPSGYNSGDSLSGTATWDNTTISGLGLTPDTYTWTWGGDPFLELVIPAAGPAVPEPSSLVLAGTAMGLAGFARWTRRRRAAAAAAKPVL